MNGKRLLCIVLSLAAVCSMLLIRNSTAWFNTSTGESPSGTIYIKDMMAFEFLGSLGSFLEYTQGTGSQAQDPRYLLTDQNLIEDNGGKITVVNHSSIATTVRFKVTYETPGSSSNASHVYTGAATDSLEVTIPAGWTGPDNDGYYSRDFSTSDTEVDAITYIGYKDSLLNSNNEEQLHHDDYVGNTMFSGGVRVDLQAKQQNNVSWDDVIDWYTS